MNVHRDKQVPMQETPISVQPKQILKPLELEQACALLNYPSSADVLETESELDRSRKLAEEILEHPIEKGMVVGSGVPHLPYLLALTGVDVTVVDAGVEMGLFKRMQTSVEELLRVEKVNAPLQIRYIQDEFGALSLPENNLEPGTFDLITLVELVGGRPVGSPKAWLLKARELLKPEAYLVVDDTSGGTDRITTHFSEVFPEHEVIKTGFNGVPRYSTLRSNNTLYRVINRR